MPKNLAVVLGLVLGLGGLVHLVLGLVDWIRERRLLRDGSEAIGKVVDEVTDTESESRLIRSGLYRYIARYEVEGRAYHVTSRFAGARGGLRDREVVILYDPSDPNRARFKHDRGLLGGVLGPALFVLAMIGLFLFGMW